MGGAPSSTIRRKSFFQIEPRLETSPATADSRRSARQLAPAFQGIFFKLFLRFCITLRMARVWFYLSPSMPCLDSVERFSSATSPAALNFFLAADLIANLLLHPGNCGHAKTKNICHLFIRDVTDSWDENAQAGANLPGCFGLLNNLAFRLNHFVTNFRWSGHFFACTSLSFSKSR
jgi:hypothetical protein